MTNRASGQPRIVAMVARKGPLAQNESLIDSHGDFEHESDGVA